MTPPVPHDIIAALARAGLIEPGEQPLGEPLTGGVSSDIWRIDVRDGAVCVKRALPKLRVAANWEAPIERNAFEVAWMAVAAAVNPQAVPRLRGHDDAAGLFIMDYLDPAAYRLWKADLRDGCAEPAVAAAVGERLVRIHAATAHSDVVARRFPTDSFFHALRLAPYLEATAERHPAVAGVLHGLMKTTANSREALVHGDVSPKNILIGPHGPVFLDAECAWYGDPAFDLAFCLNHLLLKCLWNPAAAPDFGRCFEALCASYARGVTWTAWPTLEQRAARLLPGLLLARVDGKSPVEYLNDETQKNIVRRAALALLVAPLSTLGGVLARWNEELQP